MQGKIKWLNIGLLIIELLVFVVPITIYLGIGIFAATMTFSSQPIYQSGILLGISLLALGPTAAVWYVTIAAIKRVSIYFQIGQVWWYLVSMGFLICMLVIAATRTPGMPFNHGDQFISQLSVFRLGIVLLIPAIHSMLVFRYA